MLREQRVKQGVGFRVGRVVVGRIEQVLRSQRVGIAADVAVLEDDGVAVDMEEGRASKAAAAVLRIAESKLRREFAGIEAFQIPAARLPVTCRSPAAGPRWRRRP